MAVNNFFKRLWEKISFFSTNKGFLSNGLTRVPSVSNSVISDLFIWRKNRDWKTFFELLNINNLINADYQGLDKDSATFFFYDEKGFEIGSKKVPIKLGRQTINIGDYIPTGYEGWGTFACFHDQVSQSVSEYGSFVAERGYSGYEWKKIGARGYVHGNLDAITKSENGIELLGTSWRRKLKYNVQHELAGPATYEFALVNPTNKIQKIEFLIKETTLGTVFCEVVSLSPRQSIIKAVKVQFHEKFQMTLTSHLYMARPIVFRLQEYSMDVFHG
jgi:hypothetical protein